MRTLFIIPNSVAPHGISEATVFETKTKGEIGDIKWFSLKRSSFSGNKFFTVKPFIGDIRRWVRRFGQYQAAHIKAWQTKHRTKTPVTKGGKREEEKTSMITKLQWKDSGVVLSDEEDSGVVAAKEESDVGDCVIVAEEEFRLPSEFLPKAWASFHLDHQHLHQLAMGEVELAMEQHRIGVGEPISEKPKARLMLRG